MNDSIDSNTDSDARHTVSSFKSDSTSKRHTHSRSLSFSGSESDVPSRDAAKKPKNITIIREFFSLCFFLVHSESYALIVAIPAVLWCVLQIFSQRKMFGPEFSEWNILDIACYTLDCVLLNSVLCGSVFIPIILSYGKRSMPMLPMYMLFTLGTATWSTISSAFLRYWIPLVNLLMPLYLFAFVFIVYVSIKVHQLRLMTWSKIVAWYVPFVVNLMLVDFLLQRYFIVRDTSTLTFFYKIVVRFLLVPLLYTFQVFLARVICVSVRTLPPNQRLALSVTPTFFRCCLARILVARGGTFGQIIVMLCISSLNDIVMRLTIEIRDRIAMAAAEGLVSMIKYPFKRTHITPEAPPATPDDCFTAFPDAMRALITFNSTIALSLDGSSQSPFDLLRLGQADGYLAPAPGSTLPLVPCAALTPATARVYIGYGRLLFIMMAMGARFPVSAVPITWIKLLSRHSSATTSTGELSDLMRPVRRGFWSAVDHTLPAEAQTLSAALLREILCYPEVSFRAVEFLDLLHPVPPLPRGSLALLENVLLDWEMAEPARLHDLTVSVLGADAHLAGLESVEVLPGAPADVLPTPSMKIWLAPAQDEGELRVALLRQCGVGKKHPIFAAIKDIVDSTVALGPVTVKILYNGIEITAADGAGHAALAQDRYGVGEVVYYPHQDLANMHTAVLTNEMIIDSATIFSVSLMTFFYNFIFRWADVDRAFFLETLTLLTTQIAFAVTVDVLTVFILSIRNISRGQQSRFRVVWNDRSRNFLIQILLGNVIMVMFFTYRMFYALHGTWHEV